MISIDMYTSQVVWKVSSVRYIKSGEPLPDLDPNYPQLWEVKTSLRRTYQIRTNPYHCTVLVYVMITNNALPYAQYGYFDDSVRATVCTVSLKSLAQDKKYPWCNDDDTTWLFVSFKLIILPEQSSWFHQKHVRFETPYISHSKRHSILSQCQEVFLVSSMSCRWVHLQFHVFFYPKIFGVEAKASSLGDPMDQGATKKARVTQWQALMACQFEWKASWVRIPTSRWHSHLLCTYIYIYICS